MYEFCLNTWWHLDKSLMCLAGSLKGEYADLSYTFQWFLWENTVNTCQLGYPAQHVLLRYIHLGIPGRNIQEGREVEMDGMGRWNLHQECILRGGWDEVDCTQTAGLMTRIAACFAGVVHRVHRTGGWSFSLELNPPNPAALSRELGWRYKDPSFKKRINEK